jgi:hypothetical protein
MKPQPNRSGASRRQLVAVLCALAIGPGDAFAYATFARTAMPQAQSSSQDSAPIPSDQLDSLVAPIALYPDPLLAQTLAASTYPLELMELQQWLTQNSGLSEQALADAVAKQSWDPSVQSMAVLPDVVKTLTDNIRWTTNLGNAFLAQQADVMDAVQRMRQKAQAKGTLKSTEQQAVQTQSVDGNQVVVIEQANPQVVYVPSYDPATVYGPPEYPYPSFSYPSAGYYAAGAAISFGVGVAMGGFWGGHGWGWGCGWGDRNLTVNNLNNFNRAANVNRVANGAWQHNPAHRGGTPYSNRATANRFGGTTRGDSLANRQAGARQQLNRQGGQIGTSGLGDRRAVGDLGNRGSGGLGGGGDRIGSRDLSRGGGGSSAFGSGSRGFDGGRARSDFNRGSSSLGGGGFNRGGGGGGGGFSRGGGGGGSRGGGRR